MMNATLRGCWRGAPFCNVPVVVALVAGMTAVARPVIDDAHDRVQTTFDPGEGFERIGTVAQRDVKSVGRSKLAIDCSMLPRGYGDFEEIKDYLPPLGIVRVRLHAGWSKLEPKPGVWDFEWLDRQVNWLLENGMEPLLETSYGNPVYPGAGGPSLSDGLPRGEVALAAWDRYIEKLARRYPQVKDWACWNEPNNDPKLNPPELVVDNNIRTARIIRGIIPDARIAMLTLGTNKMNAYTEECLKLFKECNAVALFTSIIYHDYTKNPDDSFANRVDDWVRIVRRYAPDLEIWNGESGATSDPHYSAGISSQKWNTDLTQAKWDLRRIISDLGHGYDTLVFTLYDPCYDNVKRYSHRQPSYWIRTREDHFMKRMGLVKCNDRLQVTKVKPAYYSVQNVASVFDAKLVSEKFPVECSPVDGMKKISVYTFRKKGPGIPVVAYWDASSHPDNDNTVETVVIKVPEAQAFREPVLVDMVTGAIYSIPADRISADEGAKAYGLPIYDAPLLLTETALVHEVRVSAFGYDEEDSTRFLQAAIDSGAKKLIVDAKHWVTQPLRGRSDQEIFFADGAVIEAKKGAFLGINDSVFTFPCCSNVVIGGRGTIRMQHDDYLKPPYKKAEWRHAVDLAGSSDVRVWGLTLRDSGGDGVYVGGISAKRAKGYGINFGASNCRNVVLEDLICDSNARQGVSVTGVDGFRAERCVFRNTSGLPPQAGVDFEPNNNGNRMKNIVMCDCLFENNRGFGIELALSHSEPGKAEPFDMLFERCRTVGNASSVVVHNTRGDHTEIGGRLVFRDCSFEHPRGGALAINATSRCPFSCTITGCRIVEKDGSGKDVVTEVTEDWIGRNIPFLLPKELRLVEKPKVDYGRLEVFDAKPGQTVKLPRFTFRNNSRFVFAASKPGPVNIVWCQRAVGRFGKLREGAVRIVSLLDGTSVAASVPKDKPERLDFSAPASGFYRIEVSSRRINLTLLESDCPIAADLTDDWRNLITSSGDFYFWVADKTPALGFFVAGDGGEAIGVDLVSPSGRVAWTRDAVFSWTGHVTESAPEAGLWRASFRRASRGTFEDWSVDLAGADGFLFLSPDRYWKRH